MTHRPFIGVVLSFGFGVFCGIHCPVNFRMLWLAAVVLLLLSSGFFQNHRGSIVFLFLCFASIGALYTVSYRTLWNNDLAVVGRFYSWEQVRLEGVIVSDITERKFFKGKKINFELKVISIIDADETWRRPREVRGKVLVNLFRGADLAYGDQIIIEGKWHRPFNFGDDPKFSYRDYLSRKGIEWMLSVKKNGRLEVRARHQGNFMKDLAMRSRHRLKDILDDNLSPHESALMQALLIGNRTQIPKPLEELFLHTGTVHILAISGMNIATVAACILLFLKFLPLPRPAQFFLTILLLFFYMILTGAPPSVIRASIMAIVLLSSFLVERETEIFNSLAFAGFLLLLVNPMNLLDVGCQLSFISVLAIIVLHPVFFEKLSALTVLAQPLPKFICEGISISLAATLGVAGLIAYYFQIVTPVTILANLLIITLMTVIMLLGLGLLAAGLVVPFVSFMFAACIKVAISAMIVIVYLMERIPGAYFDLPAVPLYQVLIYYSILAVVFTWAFIRRSGLPWKVFWMKPESSQLGRRTVDKPWQL